MRNQQRRRQAGAASARPARARLRPQLPRPPRPPSEPPHWTGTAAGPQLPQPKSEPSLEGSATITRLALATGSCRMRRVPRMTRLLAVRACLGWVAVVLLTAPAFAAAPIYLDTHHTYEERAADLVSRMTLDEKI